MSDRNESRKEELLFGCDFDVESTVERSRLALYPTRTGHTEHTLLSPSTTCAGSRSMKH